MPLFNKPAPLIPLPTSTAPNILRHGIAPSELGIMHGQGSRVVEKMVGTTGQIPTGWRVVQDHPKRGLVVVADPLATPIDVARWLLDALGTLCIPPRTDRFNVLLYDK